MSFSSTPTVPIAALTPDLASTAGAVRGVVTVIWPYSPSQRSLSLVLAEKDFRLRPLGQVRIVFSGHCARDVANAGVVSGDELLIALEGAECLADPTANRTPAKGIEWKLRYSRRLSLAVSSGRMLPECCLSGE